MSPILYSELAEKITEWLGRRENNALEPGSALPAFAPPIIGCAAGDDYIFPLVQADIGHDFYWTPLTAYQMVFPDDSVAASDLRVISWILPQTEQTRKAQSREKNLPSIEWSKARHFGEKVNDNLRKYVVRFLLSRDIPAFAPTLIKQWRRVEWGKYGYSSTWSERHAAYCCGLGTFGISDGLITAAGKAVRIGSVIARAPSLVPTPREYTQHNEWCLLTVGKCLVCARRCPAGAISRDGHDKIKCKAYIREITSLHVKNKQLGIHVNSCGLCQTKVPCEVRNPFAFKTSANR